MGVIEKCHNIHTRIRHFQAVQAHVVIYFRRIKRKKQHQLTKLRANLQSASSTTKLTSANWLASVFFYISALTDNRCSPHPHSAPAGWVAPPSWACLSVCAPKRSQSVKMSPLKNIQGPRLTPGRATRPRRRSVRFDCARCRCCCQPGGAL